MPPSQGVADTQSPKAPPPGERARLGAVVDGLDEEARAARHLPPEVGLLVTEVIDGSVAEREGMLAGDVITEVAGTAVSSPMDIVRALRGRAPASIVLVEVLRGSQSITLPMQLDEGIVVERPGANATPTDLEPLDPRGERRLREERARRRFEQRRRQFERRHRARIERLKERMRELRRRTRGLHRRSGERRH